MHDRGLKENNLSLNYMRNVKKEENSNFILRIEMLYCHIILIVRAYYRMSESNVENHDTKVSYDKSEIQ